MSKLTKHLPLSFFLVLALLLFVPGCATQRTFSSPDDAAGSLVDALRSDNQEALKSILGSSEASLLSSGDSVADRYNINKFLESYDEKHALVPTEDGEVTIVVGASDWPLPIPIVQENGKNKWRFDTAAGLQEIINRRIGRNELDTIQVCLAVVDAQREYAMEDPDHDGIPAYARKFLSDPGLKNGLYWRTAEGEKPSPLGDLAAAAEAKGYGKDPKPATGLRPYLGYYYRILTAQGPNASGGARDYVINNNLIGGWALVAFPAEYGSSGIMSFIVNQDGILYQRDLGSDTAKIAVQMSTFDPDSNWTKVESTEPK